MAVSIVSITNDISKMHDREDKNIRPSIDIPMRVQNVKSASNTETSGSGIKNSNLDLMLK